MNFSVSNHWPWAVRVPVAGVLVFAGIICARTAQAVNLVYTFQGQATGTFGGFSFPGAQFTIRLFANSTSVVALGPGFYSVTGVPSTITVAGIGSGYFTSPKRVFVLQSAFVAGVGVAPNGGDELDIQYPDFGGYDLTTSFGPITVDNPTYSLVSSDATTFGSLTLNAISGITFEADVVPALSIDGAPGAAVLSWDASATGYQLESTARIGSAAVWSPVTNTPVVVGAYSFVTNVVSAGPRFFRLRK